MTIIALPRRAAALTAAAVLAAAATTALIPAPKAQAALSYGAIAYDPSGANAQVWNYPSRSDAEQAATDYCGYSRCKVLTSFTACGAVAFDGTRLYGGSGPTLAAASRDAKQNLGGGYIDSWACNDD
jgi:hypothetical protein